MVIGLKMAKTTLAFALCSCCSTISSKAFNALPFLHRHTTKQGKRRPGSSKFDLDKRLHNKKLLYIPVQFKCADVPFARGLHLAIRVTIYRLTILLARTFSYQLLGNDLQVDNSSC
ncbi:uncharacterized protein LOC132636569 isoform X2 [Lycium barbarum]|uniref:uncharacterized protein LOC132636569 isoform X2 n=1 Tax=Lycium barbarum TaxID=112863 RepID=UPI00293F6E4A|nr:uncharacterized protein LOC132636569 isoform X2 [Lycium barbarum]